MALCFLLPPSLRKASNRCSGSLPSPTASDCRYGPSGLDGTSHMAGRHPANPDILSSIRSEERTSELQSLMRISYAVFCLKTEKLTNIIIDHDHPPTRQTTK